MRRWLVVFSILAVGPAASAQSSPDVADAISGEVVRLLYVQSDRHWHKGEYAHIVNLNRMVVAAWPRFTDPYVDSCWLLWSMGRNADAEVLYDQGIAANPDSYELYYEKGFYLINRKKDLKGGLKLLEEAVSKRDCAKIVLHTLAHAYEKDGQLQKALETWTRAAEDPANPGRAAARVNRERVRRALEGRKQE